MTTGCGLIVLNVTKMGEKSLVIHCLTVLYGRRSFLITASSKNPMALFQPLSVLDAEVVENPKSDLWRIKALKARYPLMSIRTDMRKNAMVMFMSELLYRTIRDGDSEPGLFDWCVKSILALESMEDNFSNFHLRFVLELAMQMGFEAGIEDLKPFVGEYYSKVKELLQIGFCETMMLPMTGKDRSAIAEILIKYLSYHTESNINVRSLKVLGELF